MDYSSLRTAAEIITAFHKCQNAGEQIDLFEALATSYDPPVEAFVEILRGVILEPLIVLTIYTFGKIKDADTRERLKQSEDLLAILSEKAQSGETDSIRLSAAKIVVNLGFDFIALSRYFREDPKKIADRITRDKLKEKGLFSAKYNEVRDLKSKLDRQLEQIKSTNSDVYYSVIANNNFKDIPSVNIVDDDEYDLILNDYVQCLNILHDNDYVQSLRDELSRLQGEVTKFYKNYKENQLAIIDNKIITEQVNLKKFKLERTIYCLVSLIISYLVILIIIVIYIALSNLRINLAPILIVAYSHLLFFCCFIALKTINLRKYRIHTQYSEEKEKLLFDIVLFFFGGGPFPGNIGGILSLIVIRIYRRKISVVKKNIEEAESQKSNEPYRLNDEEQKILNLLSI